jgi:hypothetical protein
MAKKIVFSRNALEKAMERVSMQKGAEIVAQRPAFEVECLEYSYSDKQGQRVTREMLAKLTDAQLQEIIRHNRPKGA